MTYKQPHLSPTYPRPLQDLDEINSLLRDQLGRCLARGKGLDSSLARSIWELHATLSVALDEVKSTIEDRRRSARKTQPVRLELSFLDELGDVYESVCHELACEPEVDPEECPISAACACLEVC